MLRGSVRGFLREELPREQLRALEPAHQLPEDVWARPAALDVAVRGTDEMRVRAGCGLGGESDLARSLRGARDMDAGPASKETARCGLPRSH
jgi:hypothetical protein